MYSMPPLIRFLRKHRVLDLAIKDWAWLSQLTSPRRLQGSGQGYKINFYMMSYRYAISKNPDYKCLTSSDTFERLISLESVVKLWRAISQSVFVVEKKFKNWLGANFCYYILKLGATL